MDLTSPSRPLSVTVEVPATSANLGPGFDCLGLALDLTDEITVSVAPTGTTDVVEIAGECAETLPRDETHLILRTVRTFFAEIGHQPGPLRLQTTNRIPHGRGLGSSAAAVVGALTAASALVGGVPPGDLLQLAARIEGHPDNVAPCLYGGLTVAWYDESADEGPYRSISVRPHDQVIATVAVPTAVLSTRVARGLLPDVVPLRDAAANAGRAALAVHAFTSDPRLLLDATKDYLHQQYRAVAYPASYDLVGRLRERSVAAAISGAGPSVISFTVGRSLAQDVVDDLAGPGIFVVRRALIRAEGARVIRTSG